MEEVEEVEEEPGLSAACGSSRFPNAAVCAPEEEEDLLRFPFPCAAPCAPARPSPRARRRRRDGQASLEAAPPTPPRQTAQRDTPRGFTTAAARRCATPQRPELSAATVLAGAALRVDLRPLGYAEVRGLCTADVLSLLARMGLAQYATAFRHNEVTGECLLQIGHAELITDLGMREADAHYLAGAVRNLWCNLRW